MVALRYFSLIGIVSQVSDADNLFESVLITLFDMSFYNLDIISY